jgi:somatic embryogenesis receptor kinase 1
MSEVVTMLEGHGGLPERWEEWLKVADQDVELGPRRTSDWIAESAYVPRAVELSGPR